MNLHQLAVGAIRRVNQTRKVRVRLNTGPTTTLADGTRQPSYKDYWVTAQVQELTHDELRLVEGMNLQGAKKMLYMNGHVEGAVRAHLRGGDLFVIDGETWLVERVIESWSDWCKALVVLQNGG